jgi:hypothetical protein
MAVLLFYYPSLITQSQCLWPYSFPRKHRSTTPSFYTSYVFLSLMDSLGQGSKELLKQKARSKGSALKAINDKQTLVHHFVDAGSKLIKT